MNVISASIPTRSYAPASCWVVATGIVDFESGMIRIVMKGYFDQTAVDAKAENLETLTYVEPIDPMNPLLSQLAEYLQGLALQQPDFANAKV